MLFAVALFALLSNGLPGERPALGVTALNDSHRHPAPPIVSKIWINSAPIRQADVRGDETQTHCGVGIEKVEEEFAARYRTDALNGDTFHKYHILLIAQRVKFGTGVASGNIVGLKSPRIDDETSPKLCAFIFDQQIRAWMDRLYPSTCGYSSGARRDYVSLIVDWAVGHELGREIGDLHSLDDPGAQFEHNQAQDQHQADYMRNLTECDPVTYVNNPLTSIFCSDTDTIPTNNCRDLLKRKFNIP